MDGEQTTETIDLDGVPEQIPASILPDDAQQITGRLATHGDAWSAFARFQSEMSSHALVDHIQLAATGEGYTHREHAHDGTSTVSVYDGADGSILTVTVHDLGERRSVGAVRVSP